jgi:hypothetical protein
MADALKNRQLIRAVRKAGNRQIKTASISEMEVPTTSQTAHISVSHLSLPVIFSIQRFIRRHGFHFANSLSALAATDSAGDRLHAATKETIATAVTTKKQPAITRFFTIAP